MSRLGDFRKIKKQSISAFEAVATSTLDCTDLTAKPAMLVPMSGVCGHGDGVGHQALGYGRDDDRVLRQAA